MTTDDLIRLERAACMSWLEIDIGAVQANFRAVRALVRPPAQVYAVVKADAYGHGALPVAKALCEAGADALCVARVEEAMQLRAAGLTAPMLVFTPPFAEQAAIALDADASMVVCDRAHVEAAAAAARARARSARIHLKVDIGMGRLGVRPDDALPMLRLIADYPELELEGVMSHFPCADMKPPTVTRQQIQLFDSVRRAVLAAGFSVPCFHVANSAATLDYPESHFDAVRVGIALYGQYPSPEISRRIALRPAMALKTRIVFLKDVPAGTGLSYGHTFVTTRASRIATVPLGYADGYPRHASNRTVMIVRGQAAAVRGRVCMDHTLLDVTDVPRVELGDEVLAFGASDGSMLPADAVAAAAGTIGYELTTRVGRRLPRFTAG